MKQFIKNILFFILFFSIAFLCWSLIFLFGKGFLWTVSKIDGFLNQLCFNECLGISSIVLNAISFGFVATIITIFVGVSVYLFLFKNTPDIN